MGRRALPNQILTTKRNGRKHLFPATTNEDVAERRRDKHRRRPAKAAQPQRNASTPALRATNHGLLHPPVFSRFIPSRDAAATARTVHPTFGRFHWSADVAVCARGPQIFPGHVTAAKGLDPVRMFQRLYLFFSYEKWKRIVGCFTTTRILGSMCVHGRTIVVHCCSRVRSFVAQKVQMSAKSLNNAAPAHFLF